MSQPRHKILQIVTASATLCLSLALSACGVDNTDSDWSLEDEFETPPPDSLANCAGTLPERAMLNVEGGDTVQYSLALEPSGCPRVTLHQNPPRESSRLLFGAWTGQEWQYEVIADNVGNSWDNSLTFDPAGRPSVAYEAESGEWLMYTWRDDDGRWHTEQVAKVNPWDIRHAFDSASQPVIAVVSAGEPSTLSDPRLLYFYRDAEGWQQEQVLAIDETLSLQDGLAFDSEGNVHLGFAAGQNYQGLYYASRTGPGSWSGEHIEMDRFDVVTVDLEIGDGDEPHLLYCGQDHDAGTLQLTHRFRGESGWTEQRFDTDSLWCGPLAAGEQGRLHALLNEPAPDNPRRIELRHGVWDGDTWSVFELEGEFQGGPRLELDARTGRAHILATTNTTPPDWPGATRRTPVYFHVPLDPQQTP